MATMNSGLGGTASGLDGLAYGEGLLSLGNTSELDGGNLDDGYVLVDITGAFTSGINFFGQNYSEIHINTNGLITFGSPETAYTPISIGDFGTPAIAPFWSDVDLSKGGELYWDIDGPSGTVTITWLQVAPYTGAGTNSFQVVLTDTGGGDLSVEFIYDNIDWTNGFTGDATVGFTDGAGNDVELPGSEIAGDLEDFDTTDFGNGDPDGTWEIDITGNVITSSNFVVDGTSGDDIIDVNYADDPENDFVDANDGTGVDRNDDVIDGMGGDDTITGGLGNDIITGGAGNDTFIYNVGDGSDTINDFGAGSTDANDGDATNNDFINLTPFYTNSTELLADLADDNILNQSVGDFTDNTALAGGSIDGLSGLIGLPASSIEEQTGVACFTRGTLIATGKGEVPVEMLKAGHKVLTQDRGLQELRLVLSRVVVEDELQRNPKLYPVRIRAGAIGSQLPKRDLIVSRQHRLVAKSRIIQRMFNAATVLVSAIKLTELPRISVDKTFKTVEYFHLIFENHEIIFAEGTPTESFFIGFETRKTLPAAAWEEIVTLFPDVDDLGHTPFPARTIPTNNLQKKLVQRHLKNSKELFSA